MSELTTLKKLLSHTSLPYPKQKLLPGSKSSAEMEARRGGPREDTEGLSFTGQREGVPIPPGMLKQKHWVEWVEVDWKTL